MDHSWYLNSKILLSALAISILAITSCQDSTVNSVDQTRDLGAEATDAPVSTTASSETLLVDTFDIANTTNINQDLGDRQDGSATPVGYVVGNGVNYYGGPASITDNALVTRGNYVQSFAPDLNVNSAAVTADGGFTVCMDAATFAYNTAPNPDPNAIRLGISLGHESTADAVAGYDGADNDGYLRLGGNTGTGFLAGGTGTYTPFTFDTETALGKVYSLSLSVATSSVATGNAYTATLYIDGVEQASFSSSWDSNSNYVGFHGIDGSWSYDNLIIASGASAGCAITTAPSDDTPPALVFTDVVANLWPPNHKMVYAGSVLANDESEIVSFQVTVSSDEADNGRGDGNTPDDYEVVSNDAGGYDIYLRAERSGRSDGRIYTVTATAEDEFGNSASESYAVSVAKSRKK